MQIMILRQVPVLMLLILCKVFCAEFLFKCHVIINSNIRKSYALT